jgi:hypothetical protein
MNLRFIGDALDHWKGSVFRALQQSNLLLDFQVDAMASDAEAWRENEHLLYAKLLRIHRHQIVPHKHTLNGNRNLYFGEAPIDGDLFLDPDTGFQTGRVKDPIQYLTSAELFSLLGQNKKRIVIIDQHVHGKRTRDRVKEVLDVLRNDHPHFSCISYESGTAALLLFSFEHRRVRAIGDHFRVLLGVHAKNRIGEWE